MDQGAVWRPFGQFTFVSFGHAKEKRKHCDEEQVDVQVLQVRQVGVELVHEDDGGVLGQGVAGHVLEDADGGH